MNGKKTLLVVTLACGMSAAAIAQGLVGPPVDPRYGQPDPAPTPAPAGSNAKTSSGPTQSATAKIADAAMALMLATRL